MLDKTNIISVDINRLKYTNDNFGYEIGDQLLIASGCMMKSFPDAQAICRVGGDEIFIITYVNFEKNRKKIEKLKELSNNFSNEFLNKVSLSVSVASNLIGEKKEFKELEKIADEQMYDNKEDYYKENNLVHR